MIEIAGFFSIWITDVIFKLAVGEKIHFINIGLGIVLLSLIAIIIINRSKFFLQVISFVTHIIVTLSVIGLIFINSLHSTDKLIFVNNYLLLIGISIFVITPVGYVFLYNIVKSFHYIINQGGKINQFEKNYSYILWKYIICFFIVCVWCCLGTYYINNRNKSIEMTYKEELARETLYHSFSVYDGEYLYPDDYSGVYGKGFKMYVLVTEEDSIKHYSDILSEYDDFVEYRVVDYSYNYLKEHMDELELEIRTGEYNLSVIRCEVDVQKNKGRIVVFCDDFDKLIDDYANDDAVYFVNGKL